MVHVPSAYKEGYERARRHDPAGADSYLRHTGIGDPMLDPVMEELASLPPPDLHRFIRAGIEQDDEVLRGAPKCLRDFFGSLEDPSWLDREMFIPGIRAFHANADLMLIAFVTGVLVEGLSTLISKSFFITERTVSTSRRLRQNNRHLLDIFFPRGLYRDNDGWKLSTRIRFVHARVRSLLSRSELWDHDAWGTPLSAAHLGFAISVFSRRLLDYAELVGAKFDQKERESVLAVWRYSGYLMGIPETILYTTGAEAKEIYKIAYMCEPAPDADSIAVANGLIQAIPRVVDVTDPAEIQSVTNLAYRLSRALIGNRLANRFEYPKTPVFGTLFLFRTKQRILRMLKGGQMVRSGNFSQLLQISAYDDYGLTYELPDHEKHSMSNPW
jgi:hypothetical protein